MHQFNVDLSNLEYVYKHEKKVVTNYNPIPCPRITSKMKYTSEQWAKYTKYKEHILESFISTFDCVPSQFFDPKIQYDFFIKIAFKNKTHGDIADNIVKPVLDAIFDKKSKLNDKLIQTHTNFCYNDKTSLDIIFMPDLEECYEDYLFACEWLKNKV